MPDVIAPLIRDLVAWVVPAPRPYGDVIAAWRTNCPRLTVWEDAVEAGYVTLVSGPDGTLLVAATPAGRALLAHR